MYAVCHRLKQNRLSRAGYSGRATQLQEFVLPLHSYLSMAGVCVASAGTSSEVLLVLQLT